MLTRTLVAVSEQQNDGEIVVRAAQVLLDLVSAGDVEPGAYPDGWAQPFAHEHADIGAVTARLDDEGVVHLSFTRLIAAAAEVMDVLVRSIAEERGVDRLAVISTLREHLDGLQ